MCYFDEKCLATICDEYILNIWDITTSNECKINSFEFGNLNVLLYITSIL